MSFRSLLIISGALLGLIPLAAHADTPSADISAEDTPRSAVSSFLSACRAGNYAQAARYLDLPANPSAPPPELAKRFKAVLDRHLWIDLAKLSDQAGGERDDDLPDAVDEIGRIERPGGGSDPVRMTHVDREPHWVFSRATVRHIDDWYAELSQHWLLEHLPDPLLRPGPGDLLWWQWLALPLLLGLAWLAGVGTSGVLRRMLSRLVARTRTQWDDALLARLGAPVAAMAMIAVLAVTSSWLSLNPPAQALSRRVLHVAFIGSVFWALARCVDVAEQVASSSAWGTRATAASLVRLGARVSKVGVVVLAVVAVLSAWGYSVASLLAGLGIGGLAVALAAQKTVENLFGAFSIGLDQPFREGDFVKVEDFVGTVERIGLRSTRIRTLDRTLITLPNGKLADMRLESFAARDRIRLACTLGLVYETTPAQMRRILSRLEAALRAHPKIWPDAVVVRFAALADFSLNVDVMAWFLTSDWNEFQTIRQDLFLEFMDIVDEEGSSFAFPTRTLHVIDDTSARAARSQRSDTAKFKA